MRSMEEIVADYIMEESRLPPYALPSPLVREDGSRISTAFEWMNVQRAKIRNLFEKEEYGFLPPRPDSIRFETQEIRDDALNNTAIRKIIRLNFAMNSGKHHSVTMLLYLPKHVAKPCPGFLGLNFKGCHATTGEPDVPVTGFQAPGQPVFPDARGTQAGRWCFPEVIRRGYASATLCYHDFYPDFRNAEANSIYGMFFDPANWDTLSETYSPIGAWAWGLSRALDYLESDPDVDASRIALHGHSRLGKTSLWAGACDPRFKLVISNDSGCAGGALHKRKFGENVEALISHSCADWFVKAFHKYSGKEEDMPFDQHELLALIAPRPLAVGTATEDFHADPKGEFLSCVHASEVYRLFGSEGLPVREMPPPDAPVMGEIGFHYRTGGHDQTWDDWKFYLDFADRHL